MKDFNYYLKKVKEQKINEDIFNTEKQTKLDNHQQTVQEFNAKKNSFQRIFSQPQERWEDEANKIIDGNIYLQKQWQLSKIENDIRNIEDQLRKSELTKEEKDNLQERLNDNNKKLQETKKDLDNKIRQDLAEINAM